MELFRLQISPYVYVDQEPTLKQNIWSEGEKEICHAL